MCICFCCFRNLQNVDDSMEFLKIREYSLGKVREFICPYNETYQ